MFQNKGIFMKKSIISIALLLSTIASAETYQDTQSYKNYKKLPKNYQSSELESIYRDGYAARKTVEDLPCKTGGTVNDCINQKSAIKAVDDLGWNTFPYQGEFDVERTLLIGSMRTVYRWHVDKSGKATATNGHAIGITR